MCSRTATIKSTSSCWDNIQKTKQLLKNTDAIVIGAGAGLSTSAGFTYSGKRFEENFPDFIEKYGFKDMYSAGFYPFDTLEEYWAYWSRYIFINRYQNAPKDVYTDLYNLVKNKDYFVLTTNVDHCFQKAGFDKHRLFYTQGDYGLWQCSKPCHTKTYDNEPLIKKMVAEQKDMRIPSALVPYCPICGAPMSMNLRSDSTLSGQGDTRFCTTDLRFCCVTVAQRTSSTLRSSALQNRKSVVQNSFGPQVSSFGGWQGNGMRRTGRTPIDVNAASRQKTALGACVPLSTEGNYIYLSFVQIHALFYFNYIIYYGLLIKLSKRLMRNTTPLFSLSTLNT